MILPKYIEILNLLDTIEQACNCITSTILDPALLFMDIQDAIHCINQQLFNSEIITYNDVDNALCHSETDADLSHALQAIKEWHGFIMSKINNRVLLSNNMDVQFYQIMDYIEYVDYQRIVEQTKEKLNSHPADIVTHYNLYYQHFSYFWGSLDTTNNDYTVVENRITALKEHREEFIWLYSHLGDYRSKNVLLNFLRYWLSYDIQYIENMCENQFDDYYDLDLLKCSDDEVFVDLGAYTGDSALNFIQTYHRYKKIYCYEISKDSIAALKKNLEPYPNIEILSKGAGSSNYTTFIQDDDRDASCNQINAENGTEVEIVTIDDSIKEKVTIIKMDIEGAEQEALMGCKRHIMEDHPKLLICVYHNNEDIWKIAKMITEMRDDYTFYLRSNGQQWGPSEIVLFAL